MTPAPTPVVIAVLSGLPAVTADTDRVSTTLLSPLPALRVAKVGDAETPDSPSIAPLFQVEVWAEDELEAEQLAWDLKNAWTSSEKQVFPDLRAVVHGRWVVQDPLSLPANDKDADDTGLSRFMVTVAFRLTRVING
jgi:hypothetical protein